MSIMFLQKREIPLRENEPLPEWVEAEVIERHTYVGQDGEERPGFVSMNRYCQRQCDFVIFRRTGNVRKWRIKVCSL